MTTVAGAAAHRREASGRSAASASIWTILLLLFGAYALAHDASRGWDSWTRYAAWGELGVANANGAGFDVILGPCGSDRFCHVGPVDPAGPMAALGVRQGDVVRLDRTIDGYRVLRLGEPVGFTLRRDGRLSHLVAKAGPLHRNQRARPLAAVAAWAIVVLVGLFIALRSGGRASTLLLSAALIAMGSGGSVPGLTESQPSIFIVVYPVLIAVYICSPVLLLAFAGAVEREARDKLPGHWAAIFWAYIAASAFAGVNMWAMRTLRPSLGFGVLPLWLQVLGSVLTMLALASVWRNSRGQDRTRYGFMILAVSLLTTGQTVLTSVVNATGDDWSLANPAVSGQIVCNFAGAVVFAYAVLRHRVLDLGFAVNRTLVYGVFSSLLLVAFGLVEWAVEHVLPRAARETSAVIDAGVALAVFLTFHRVRDVVEHLIEGIFFRAWQQAEAALRRFVRDAAFATRPETLSRAFAEALSRYSDGAEAAVYILRDGAYHRADGRVAGMGETLDADAPVLLAMRAEPKPLIPEADDSSIAAALIAPMVNRNEVIGLVVLGPKPSGSSYRPDEVELIGWAARQVGLDLHALKVERLEAEKADLGKTVAVLERALALKSESA
jgi:hypothetical protein